MGVPAGYDLTLTTEPYYRSTYLLVYAKNRGWDDIKSQNDVLNLDAARKEKLRIAMFDRGPGTAWIVNNGLVDQGVPYQSMTGDPDTNTAMTIEKDLKAGAIDMAILWGPIVGYLFSNSEPGTFAAFPMQSVAGLLLFQTEMKKVVSTLVLKKIIQITIISVTILLQVL